MAGDAAYTHFSCPWGCAAIDASTQVATIKQIVLRSETRKLGAQCSGSCQ